MRTAGAVLAMLAVTMIGALLWGGPVTSLWERTLAGECPAAAPRVGLPGKVAGPGRVPVDDYAEGHIPYGYAAKLTPTIGDRLGLTRDSHDLPVTVTCSRPTS